MRRLVMLAVVLALSAVGLRAQSNCTSPVNPIVAENCLPGNPPADWDISGAGDNSIQGFATGISVNRGGTISFKIVTSPLASSYTIDIFRIGYYQGNGARKIASIAPSAALPQSQPACLQDAATGLVDCGNWAVSASWTVPPTATSGIYFAKLTRTDGVVGVSHVMFIVRDDASHSDLLFQTADTAWQAYNEFGGNSLYVGSPAGRAFKVSYNRPITTGSSTPEDFVWNAEYPMVRFLEANGYNVTYFTGVDADRFGSLILNHKLYLSVGHDEYWSGAQRQNVEAARNAGVHLAFFSGNESFWKTRWESSIDPSRTSYRTLVSYKETHANAVIDPADPPTWTGTWRDPRFSPPADGGRPENSMSGTIFVVNGYRSDSIVVPFNDGKLRFWRNTDVAILPLGGSHTMPAGTLGYEWDADLDNGARPAGLIRLSSAAVSGVPLLQDFGSTYATGTAVHHATLYRASSGALVFGAGTVQWAWGLDANHMFSGPPVDRNMQQATVNLFADMGVQPATLQLGLFPATASTDTTPPISTINYPAPGSAVPGGSPSAITGTASDAGGGLIGGVEVSTDGGLTWHPADGRESWSYTWTNAKVGSATIMSRAVDDSGNLESPSTSITVTVNSGTDTIPPTVVSVTPANGATGLSLPVTISATFSEPLNLSTVNSNTFFLRNPSNQTVAATVIYDPASRIATLYPSASLAFSTTYRATLRGGSVSPVIMDVSGNRLSADFTWSFTTGSQPPPPDSGPGGPILVIGSLSNPFGRYVGEILSAEGLNSYTTTDISLVTPARLAGFDVVILGQMSLNSSQVTMFTDYVNAGGHLIAMRPDAQLAGLFGLTPVGTTLKDAYLLVNTSTGPGVGIVSQTIQFHDTADLYNLNGASAVATLYSTATAATAFPAVTLRAVGANGGQAAAFTYELPRSIVYTRQGNPAWSGQERDGISPIRTDDLFFGASATDPRPDYVDLNKVAIPQADEQMHLLVNLMEQMNQSKKPLPRFWYFPFGKKAVVVMTGDDHANGGTPGRFDKYIAASPAGCSVANWECIRSTSYIYPEPQFLSDARAASYNAQGFEIALHVNTNCADWTPSTLDAFYADQLSTFRAAYPSLPAPSTNRTHCIAWSDYDSQPQVERKYGIRLDSTYYYWPATWVQNRPGFFTGSGLPMRFVQRDGSITDVYQATSQMTDESSQEQPFTAQTLLNNATGSPGFYGAFNANMHTDVAPSSESDAIIQTAKTLGVPVVSARQMLTWLDARNASSFGNFSWNGFTLSFTIAPASGANGLQAMVPASMPVGPLTGITLNLVPVSYTLQTIKGVQYAMLAASAGNWQATYKIDIVPPVISNVTVTPADGGVALVTWTTNEVANSHIDFGSSPTALTIAAGDANSVTSHTLTLTGLAFNATYYFRVTSADPSGNTATFPAASNPPLSFTMPPPRFHDTTLADFSAGTGNGTQITRSGDGEVILMPSLDTEFPGSSLPSDWSSATWNAGGAATVANGLLTVDGARAGTTAVFSPGRTLEFDATFSGASFQHAGFGLTFNEGLWAIFSTWGGGALYARTNNGAASNDVLLPGSWLGAQHHFRIDWTSTSLIFWIDGTQVSSQNIAITSSMRPLASDYTVGGGSITLQALRMTPYQASGTFLSRVYDATGTASWGSATWVATLPAGTGLAISYRTGNTPAPDGTWTNFTAIPGSGTTLGASSRYIQYQAQLTTANTSLTPVLQDISIVYQVTAPVSTPPTITSRSPAPGATGVPVNSVVTVQFSEAMNPNTINSSTFFMRAAGAASNVPAAVSYSNRVATLTPSSPLSLGTTYQVTVSGGVADLSGLTLGPDATWSFSATASASVADTTVADFSSGTTGTSTAVVQIANGEVLLMPAVESEFSGTTLPADFSSTAWTAGGAATVGGGVVTVDGARLNTNALFGPGRSLEFSANFSGDAFEHAGFGITLNETPWAIFSTAGGGALFARTNNGSASTDTQIPGTWLGSMHRYRIDWTPSAVVYSIDGVQVASHPLPIAVSMRPLVSDFNAGGGTVAVDWMRLSPYAASGVFQSRVLDAGSAVNWGTATWTADLPAGTSITVSFRMGNTPTPDTTWTAFTAVAGSGATIGGNARYIQYQVTLATTDPIQTPVLRDITLVYSVGTP